MIIEVDPARVPPIVSLLEPDDFTSLSVVVRGPQHAYVDPDVLRHLAGPLGTDPAWLSQLDRMVEYAEQKGWTRDGALRAHLE